MTQSPRIHIDPATTVNDIIKEHPTTVAAFNALGVDACCGGDASLADATQRDGVDIDALLAALDAMLNQTVEVP